MTPGTYPLIIYRGDTYAWRFVLWQDQAKTIPVDLTGFAVAAEIRDKPAGKTIQAISLGVTLPNIISASLTGAQTGQLPASGRWDLQLTDFTGWISTILAGPVTVTGDITDSTGEPGGLATSPKRGGRLAEA